MGNVVRGRKSGVTGNRGNPLPAGPGRGGRAGPRRGDFWEYSLALAVRRRSPGSGHFGLCPRVSTAPGSTWRESRRWDLGVSGRSGQGGWRGGFPVSRGAVRTWGVGLRASGLRVGRRWGSLRRVWACVTLSLTAKLDPMFGIVEWMEHWAQDCVVALKKEMEDSGSEVKRLSRTSLVESADR